MRDGSDAIADWPLLNAMLNVASGAAWVGAPPRRRRRHRPLDPRGAQVVADGTDEGALRVERVLTNDPGTGVMRHAHAGYDEALDHARATGLDLPGIDDMTVTLVPEVVLDATGVHRDLAVVVDPDDGTHRRGLIGAGARAGRRRLADAHRARARLRERPLARVPARPARPGRARSTPRGRRTTSGRGARRCTRPPARIDPDAHRTTSRGAASRRCATRATPRSASSTTSTTSPTARRTTRPNALAEAVCAAAEEVGLRIVLLLVGVRARRLRAVRPIPASGASATRPSRPTWRGSRRSQRGPPTGRWSRSAPPRTPCAPSPADWLERDRRALRRPRPACCTSTPTSSRARSRSALAASTACARSS